MDVAIRTTLRIIKAHPELLSTQDAIELHEAVAGLLKSRSFTINYIATTTFYDNGVTTLLPCAIKHLERVLAEEKATLRGMNIRPQAIQRAIEDPYNNLRITLNRMVIPEPTEITTLPDGRVVPRQPYQVGTQVNLDSLPVLQGWYGVQIRELHF